MQCDHRCMLRLASILVERLSVFLNTLNVAACYELDAALKECGHTKFHLVKGNSDEMIGLVLKECGPCVVFLDGNHSYDQTMKDFMAVKNATDDHCTVIFHN